MKEEKSQMKCASWKVFSTSIKPFKFDRIPKKKNKTGKWVRCCQLTGAQSTLAECWLFPTKDYSKCPQWQTLVFPLQSVLTKMLRSPLKLLKFVHKRVQFPLMKLTMLLFQIPLCRWKGWDWVLLQITDNGGQLALADSAEWMIS